MNAPLAARQALVKDNVKSQAVKPSGSIEIQIVLTYPWGRFRNFSTVLKFCRGSVMRRSPPINNAELLNWKVLQPPFQMFGVDAGSYCLVFCVHAGIRSMASFSNL